MPASKTRPHFLRRTSAEIDAEAEDFWQLHVRLFRFFIYTFCQLLSFHLLFRHYRWLICATLSLTSILLAHYCRLQHRNCIVSHCWRPFPRISSPSRSHPLSFPHHFLTLSCPTLLLSPVCVVSPAIASQMRHSLMQHTLNPRRQSRRSCLAPNNHGCQKLAPTSTRGKGVCCMLGSTGSSYTPRLPADSSRNQGAHST